MAVRIVPVSNDDPRLRDILRVHKTFSVANTPGGGGHALAADADLTGLRYWIAVEDDSDIALGGIGFQLVEPGHGEVKSMHVREHTRGMGLGARLVQTLLDTARAEGCSRVSLETHLGDGFAASRRLYARCGFEPCESFGPYSDDPASFCMTQAL